MRFELDGRIVDKVRRHSGLNDLLEVLLADGSPVFLAQLGELRLADYSAPSFDFSPLRQLVEVKGLWELGLAGRLQSSDGRFRHAALEAVQDAVIVIAWHFLT
jgi:hypothetical protein